LYWYGTGSDPLTETDPSGNPTEEYVFFNGKRTARIDLPSAVVHYYFSDHLGSANVVTSSTGGIQDESDYYPFGGERAITNSDPNNYKFTGKERDTESNLDNFGARSDSSNLGRFMSPDPVIITPARLKNPQQVNLYSYLANNPLRYIDPTGELLVATGDQKADYNDLCAIAGKDCDRLQIDEKTGNVTFDTKGLDLSKNEGAALINDLVSSTKTYEFSEGPTVNTDKGPVKIDYVIANLPSFGDQPQGGKPRSGVSDVVALYLRNPKVTSVSHTASKVALDFTIAFHELAEAFEKIDGGKSGSYAAGHNSALQRENILRDQRPYLKDYNHGAGGPANSTSPEGGIIIKK
jgi:RHS repeat-associated protein